MFLDVNPSVLGPASSAFKRCSKCGEYKPADAGYFPWEKRRNRWAAACRDCERERARQWLAGNPEVKSEINRRYRNNHPERVSQIQKNYYEAHRESVLARARRSRSENPDYERERHRRYAVEHTEETREYGSRWRKLNATRIRDKNRQYRQAHPEQIRAEAHRRRALKYASGGRYTLADIEAIRVAQGNHCYLCGKNLTEYHIDHFIPLAKGGTNDPGNLRLACPKCNLTKGAKHPFEIGRLL